MSESEDSDSAFYYPGELSDAELLQLPSHSEATERKSLLSNQEIKKFITSQQQANTVKKTTYDMNVFQRFLNECGEKRKVVEIPAQELDSLLCNFYITAKKKTIQNTNLTPCPPSREVSSDFWMTTTRR